MQAQKESSFPTESPTECKYATGFFSNFISTKLRHVTSVDFSTSLLFTNNPIKLKVHLLISFDSKFLFSFGDKKNKQLVFLHGLIVITPALGAVYN